MQFLYVIYSTTFLRNHISSSISSVLQNPTNPKVYFLHEELSL